jgi:hypothetical protein
LLQQACGSDGEKRSISASLRDLRARRENKARKQGCCVGKDNYQTRNSESKILDPLLRNQIIGGVCAGAVVIMALVRIFVLHASADGALVNLMSIANAILSLVVLTSAVRIMLSAKKQPSFEDVLAEKLREIDDRYGALVEASDGYQGDDGDGCVYSIATNTDAIFAAEKDGWHDLQYVPKFALSPNFTQTRRLLYYVNHCNMTARAAMRGEDSALTARLLARDIAVAVQRAFSDILTAHALDIHHEQKRAVVTISLKSANSARDAARIAELIDYMLFLHFVAA